MSSLNRVDLIGHLGREPESRAMQNGDKVVTLNVATTDTWKDKSTGEKRERTEWHRVVIFNQGLAGVAEQYLSKGSKLFVSGALQTRKWQDQQGQDRYSTEVVLQQYQGQIVLLGDPSRQPRQEPSQAASGGGQTPDLDDSIPFAPCQ